MQKKQFIAIARAVVSTRIQFAGDLDAHKVLDALSFHLADTCAENDTGKGGFDRGRFLEACGVPPWS